MLYLWQLAHSRGEKLFVCPCPVCWLRVCALDKNPIDRGYHLGGSRLQLRSRRPKIDPRSEGNLQISVPGRSLSGCVCSYRNRRMRIFMSQPATVLSLSIVRGPFRAIHPW